MKYLVYILLDGAEVYLSSGLSIDVLKEGDKVFIVEKAVTGEGEGEGGFVAAIDANTPSTTTANSSSSSSEMTEIKTLTATLKMTLSKILNTALSHAAPLSDLIKQTVLVLGGTSDVVLLGKVCMKVGDIKGFSAVVRRLLTSSKTASNGEDGNGEDVVDHLMTLTSLYSTIATATGASFSTVSDGGDGDDGDANSLVEVCIMILTKYITPTASNDKLIASTLRILNTVLSSTQATHATHATHTNGITPSSLLSILNTTTPSLPSTTSTLITSLLSTYYITSLTTSLTTSSSTTHNKALANIRSIPAIKAFADSDIMKVLYKINKSIVNKRYATHNTVQSLRSTLLKSSDRGKDRGKDFESFVDFFNKELYDIKPSNNSVNSLDVITVLNELHQDLILLAFVKLLVRLSTSIKEINIPGIYEWLYAVACLGFVCGEGTYDDVILGLEEEEGDDGDDDNGHRHGDHGDHRDHRDHHHDEGKREEKTDGSTTTATTATTTTNYYDPNNYHLRVVILTSLRSLAGHLLSSLLPPPPSSTTSSALYAVTSLLSNNVSSCVVAACEIVEKYDVAMNEYLIGAVVKTLTTSGCLARLSLLNVIASRISCSDSLKDMFVSVNGVDVVCFVLAQSVNGNCGESSVIKEETLLRKYDKLTVDAINGDYCFDDVDHNFSGYTDDGRQHPGLRYTQASPELLNSIQRQSARILCNVYTTRQEIVGEGLRKVGVEKGECGDDMAELYLEVVWEGIEEKGRK
jgi:hypothetical protein